MTKKGFTLLELMIAVILFAGAMIPILFALNQGLFATTYSEHRQIATTLALNEMEDQEHGASLDWRRLRTLPRDPIANFPTYQREIIVQDPTGLDPGLMEIKEVRAIVYWADKEENSVSLVTYFSNNPDGSP